MRHTYCKHVPCLTAKERVTVSQAKKLHQFSIWLKSPTAISADIANRPPAKSVVFAGYSPSAPATAAAYRSRHASVGLTPQERRDIQQILSFRLRPQAIANSPLPLDRGLVQSCVVAIRQRTASDNAHCRLSP